jgi:hypothetical protein
MQDDIRDQLDAMPLPPGGTPIWVWVAVSLATLLLILWLWKSRRRAVPQVETIDARARRRLAAIHTADYRDFHAQLSVALVEYFEARIALRSTRLTSAEIVGEFRRNGVMHHAWQAELAALLDDCDRAKFSPAPRDFDAAETKNRARYILGELAAQAASAPSMASPWKDWDNAAV